MLVQWLRERQEEENIIDEVFAGKLGLTRSHWTQIRLGMQSTLTHRIIRGALTAYPEHQEEIIRMIEADPTEAI